MKSTSEFYSRLHTSESGYSAGTYDMEALFSHRVWREWCQAKADRALSVLDVGCGKGLFLKEMVHRLQNQKTNLDRIVGLDLILSPNNFHAEISEKFEFIQHDTEGTTLPFDAENFDLVACNHVLEHVFETERLVGEFRRIIRPDGLCIISVPNLAAWMNRVALLFAGQPLGTEVGTRSITYGFWPRGFQPHLSKFAPSGHIRDFTPRALRELASACGFETIGWWKQSFGFAAKMSKWGGRNIAILLRPSRSASYPTFSSSK